MSMAPAAAAWRPPGLAGVVRRSFRVRPEQAVLLAVAVAWIVVVVWPGRLGAAHATHAAHIHPGPHDTLGEASVAPTVIAALGPWIVMSFAMMVPSALPAARHVGLNSLRRRRQRAIAVFVTVYAAVWGVFGVPVLTLTSLAGRAVSDRLLVAAALLVAVVWQVLPYKRACMKASHRTVPLPPVGRPALVGCTRFGLSYGVACVGACWPLMVTMAVTHHMGIVWMVVLTAIVITERYVPPPRLRTVRLVRAVSSAAHRPYATSPRAA